MLLDGAGGGGARFGGGGACFGGAGGGARFGSATGADWRGAGTLEARAAPCTELLDSAAEGGEL